VKEISCLAWESLSKEMSCERADV